jgi:hypothetical protein
MKHNVALVMASALLASGGVVTSYGFMVPSPIAALGVFMVLTAVFGLAAFLDD